MANLTGEIDLQIRRGPTPVSSHTEYVWTGGGQVLTITTILPDQGLAAELVSVYVAGTETEAIATHVLTACDRPAKNLTEEHTAGRSVVHPINAPCGCVYDHAHRLVDGLVGHRLSVDVGDSAFQALERVE